jgi:uncharacterized protein with PIN domain
MARSFSRKESVNMTICEICLENRSPGEGARDAFERCPHCGGELHCSGYTAVTYEGDAAHCPVCDKCGQSPILVCSACDWHNAAYDDVLSGLKGA